MSPLEFINQVVKRLGFHNRDLQRTADQHLSSPSVGVFLPSFLRKRRKHWKGRISGLQGELTVGKVAQWFVMTINRENHSQGSSSRRSPGSQTCVLSAQAGSLPPMLGMPWVRAPLSCLRPVHNLLLLLPTSVRVLLVCFWFCTRSSTVPCLAGAG